MKTDIKLWKELLGKLPTFFWHRKLRKRKMPGIWFFHWPGSVWFGPNPSKPCDPLCFLERWDPVFSNVFGAQEVRTSLETSPRPSMLVAVATRPGAPRFFFFGGENLEANQEIPPEKNQWAMLKISKNKNPLLVHFLKYIVYCLGLKSPQICGVSCFWLDSCWTVA